MKKSLLFLLTMFSLLAFSQVTIDQTYFILDSKNSGNTYFDMGAVTANPDFNNYDLGTFTTSESLVIKGGQMKITKCHSSDVTGGTVYYRIFPTSTGPTSPDYQSFAMNWQSNWDNNGCTSQLWENATGINNIISGLADGDYTIETYFAVYTGLGNPTMYDTNSGAYYKAHFTISNTTLSSENLEKDNIFNIVKLNQSYRISSKENIDEVSIIDASGRQIYKTKFLELPVEKFSKGLNFVSIKINGKTYVKKVLNN